MKNRMVSILLLTLPLYVLSDDLTGNKLCSESAVTFKVAALKGKSDQETHKAARKFLNDNVRIKDGQLTYSDNITVKSVGKSSGTLIPSERGASALALSANKARLGTLSAQSHVITCHCDGADGTCKIKSIKEQKRIYCYGDPCSGAGECKMEIETIRTAPVDKIGV